MKRCCHCGELLQFERGKGWLHEDGSLYKQRYDYPRLCRQCFTRLDSAGYCNRCNIQYTKEMVDDHCAIPMEVVK